MAVSELTDNAQYYVFVACSLFFLVMAYFYFPETRHKTLEEIAAAFGDKVVTLTEIEIAREEAVFEEKAAAGAGHVEHETLAAKV